MKNYGITTRRILWIVVVAAVYFAAGRVGLAFSDTDSGASPVYPASGVALASMLLLGIWVWPAVLIGEFLSTHSAGGSALVTLVMAIGSATAGLISVLVLDRYLGFDRKLSRIRDVLALLLVAAPLYATCTATIGITSWYLIGDIDLAEYPYKWMAWWLGDLTLIIVMVPLILAWFGARRKYNDRQILEGVFLFGTLTFLAWFIFMNPFNYESYAFSFPYILFPVTLWAALRFDMRVVTFAVMLVASIAILGTVQGMGPFARQNVISGLILVDVYIAILSLKTLIVVAVMKERLQLEKDRDRFFSLSVDMMCIRSPSGYFKWANPAFEKTLGWSIHEMTSRPVISFVHPDDVEKTCAIVDWQGKSGEEIQNFENRYRHKDGSWRMLSWNAAAQENGNMYASARDVTESNIIKAALNESEERFRTMANSIPQLAWMANPDGEIYWYNQQWYDYTGITEKESLGMGWQSILRPEDLPKILKRIKEITGKNEPWEDLSQLRRYDGVYRWHLMQMRAVKDEKGHVFQWLGTSTDITETKEAEEQVRQNEQKLNVILNSIADGVISTDTEGRIITMNPIAEQMTGWTQADAEGRPIGEVFKLIRQKTREPMFVPIADILRTGLKKGMSNHKLLIAQDGTERNMAYSASPIRLSDTENLGVVIVFRDVTEERAIAKGREEIEKHRMEKERLAREAAENANQAKSAFLSSMSHEIRTPMNAILGFAQILQRDTTLSPKQAANVGTINRAGMHLLSLIDDILEISKIEAGHHMLSPSVFSLHILLDDLEMMFRSRCEAKSLKLMVEWDKSMPQYVEGDEAKLRQVFINLLENAVKFTVQGGIAMRVKCHTLPAVGDNLANNSGNVTVQLEVEIEDSGMGIAQEEIGNLFQNFVQTSAGAKVGGTGLGLAISKKLLQMMGGDISVTSEWGKGSCFRFDALLKTAEAISVPEKPVQRKIIGIKPTATPIRALIVDDNADNRALLKALLEPLGIAIYEAVNGIEALAAMETFMPTVVLMDMRMPEMDGYEATRQMRATEKGRKMPIIAVTASVFDNAESQVLKAGVDAYVRKPLRDEHFFATLGSLLGLEYVYAEEESEVKSPKLTIEDIKELPEELVSAMRQALNEGDMEKLLEIVVEVNDLYPSTGLQLKALADNYDTERLARLFS